MTRVLLLVGLAGVFLTSLAETGLTRTEPSPVQAEWSIDEAPGSGWTVGDQIPLRLTVTYPTTTEVTLPELPHQWGPIEVLEQTLSDVVNNPFGSSTASRSATITLWAPGDYQTPPFAVRYRDPGGQLQEVAVPPLSITVVSVLEEGETEKRDLKPQATLTGPPLWPWIFGALLFTIVLGVVAWSMIGWLRSSGVSSGSAETAVDPRPPHEIAYSELDRIAALGLPGQGELKQHYTFIADCMRTYVQGRYSVPAMDQTTQELVVALRRMQTDRHHIRLFDELLSEADLVKFARFRPSIQQAQTALAKARHIVDITKPVEQADEQTDDPLDSRPILRNLSGQ